MSTATESNVLQGLEPTLPSAWYLEDGYFRLKREHIFMREWVCVAREEEIPQPGSYKVLDSTVKAICCFAMRRAKSSVLQRLPPSRGARIWRPRARIDSAWPSKAAWSAAAPSSVPITPGPTTSMASSSRTFPQRTGWLRHEGCPVCMRSVFGLGRLHLPELHAEISATVRRDHSRFRAANAPRYPLAELRIAKTHPL